jgi:5-methylcytosine-specific restriction protein A
MVAVKDVTRESVLIAMREFDDLGRDRFLERYGFGPAREYFVVEAGQRYASKALVGWPTDLSLVRGH